MNKSILIKDSILAAIALAGSTIAKALGGWDNALQTLIIFMAIDYITGVLVAAVWKRSNKSESGALESRAGFKGLIRKSTILLVVWVSVQLDLILTMDGFSRTTVVLFFCGNEGLSIIENLGIMGVPLPDFIKDKMEQLKGKDPTNF